MLFCVVSLVYVLFAFVLVDLTRFAVACCMLLVCDLRLRLLSGALIGVLCLCCCCCVCLCLRLCLCLCVFVWLCLCCVVLCMVFCVLRCCVCLCLLFHALT